MGARKQTSADRTKRINKGCCPIHGIGMAQVGVTRDRKYAIVECPRRDCSIKAKTISADGPHELLREWKYILSGE